MDSKEDKKDHLGLVVAGHLNGGKSTTTGRLIYELGGINEQNLAKLKQEAQALGKESFLFAFFTDKSPQERKRGVTINCCTKQFGTNNYHYSIIDAPGHKDYIKNMITGASQADCALLIVPADSGFEESMMKANHKQKQAEGQTRQHARLLNLYGIDKIIICINKMDDETVEYSQKRFNEITVEVYNMLKKIFGEHKASTFPFIPISGLYGDNLTHKSLNMQWFDGWQVMRKKQVITGNTLFDALDLCIKPPKRENKKALRMPVGDTFHIHSIGDVITGRIEQGQVMIGTKVKFYPADCGGTVASMQMYHKPVQIAYCGDTVGINIRGLTKKPKIGDVMCCETDENTPYTVKQFSAFVYVQDHPGKLKIGYTPVIHIRTGKVAAKLIEIKWKRNVLGSKEQIESPSFMQKGDEAQVVFEPLYPFVCEPFHICKPLGRLAGLDQNNLVLLGKVTDVVHKEHDVADTEEMEDREIRASWDIGSVCLIYSRSEDKWYDAQVEKITKKADEEEKQTTEWLIVRYKNNKKKKRIQRNCQDLKPIKHDTVLSLKKGSACLIYSNIIQLWCEGQILAVFDDKDGEWLRIKYWDTNEYKICEIQRFSKELTTFKRHLLWQPMRTISVPDKPWCALDTNNDILPPKFSNIVALNENEFIVAAYSFDSDELIDHQLDIETEERNGIYKYNIIQNRWQLWIQYPPDFYSQYHNLSIDYEAQMLYLANGIGSGLDNIWIVDIRTKTFGHFSAPSRAKDTSMLTSLWGALTYVLNGKYNIFWGGNNNAHLLWDKQSKKFECVHHFKNLTKGMVSFGMVYNQQYDYFLLFGGYKGSGLGRSDDIWKYSVSNQQWELLTLKMPDEMQSFGSVISLDGEHVLICGGSDSNGLSDKIWILDLLSMKWRLSKIKCASEGVAYGNVIIRSANNIEYLYILQGRYIHIRAPLSDILSN